MLSLGIDVGSSSVKVSIFDINSGTTLCSAAYPETEMTMVAHHVGWAEQHPEMWWQAFKNAYAKAIQNKNIETHRIESIGISYQMHGLVCLDVKGEPIRNAIIWCDSRAVPIGEEALSQLGEKYAFDHLLNSPGNFTASKLKWVKDNEVDIYAAIDKICLPGDFIGLKLSGNLTTTVTGLSEGIFYDFVKKSVSNELMSLYGFSESIIPSIKNSFDDHGTILPELASELKISTSATINYKAGDQPNNALSLNVLQAGEIAATAGTSGVVYGVSDKLFIDYSQRVNSFAHVNYDVLQEKIGILLCINGTGSANSWINKLSKATSYASMNDWAKNVKIGSDGLMVFPFGNGAERMLKNRNIGSSIEGLNFNMHSNAHIYRAFQEGIAFSFLYGIEAFQENNIDLNIIKAGHANLFLSPLFGSLVSTLCKVPIELYNTDGSVGAARGALVGKKYVNIKEAFESLKVVQYITPQQNAVHEYEELFLRWKSKLNEKLAGPIHLGQ